MHITPLPTHPAVTRELWTDKKLRAKDTTENGDVEEDLLCCVFNGTRPDFGARAAGAEGFWDVIGGRRKRNASERSDGGGAGRRPSGGAQQGRRVSGGGGLGKNSSIANAAENGARAQQFPQHHQQSPHNIVVPASASSSWLSDAARAAGEFCLRDTMVEDRYFGTAKFLLSFFSPAGGQQSRLDLWAGLVRAADLPPLDVLEALLRDRRVSAGDAYARVLLQRVRFGYAQGVERNIE